MSNRFEKVYSLPRSLFSEGCGIIISEGAIQKDTETNKVLVQLKLRNISKYIVSSCKVTIKCFDNSGNELDGVADFEYSGLSVSQGEDFGVKTPVFLPDNNTSMFSAVVTEIISNDKKVWNNTSAEWTPVPTFKSISEELKYEQLIKQFELDNGNEYKYVPEIRKGLFLCSCGNINLAGEDNVCYKCGSRYTFLKDQLDVEKIGKRAEERLKTQQEADEATGKKRQKKSKIVKASIAAILTVAVVGGVFAFVYPTYIKPSKDYEKAIMLEEQGDYDQAIKQYLNLGSYKDASDKVKSTKYKKASSLVDGKKYDDALALFDELNDYDDSKDRILDTKYKKADELQQEELFDNAITIFSELGSYSDSETMIKYIQAKQLKKDNKLFEAIESFNNIISFRDSKELYEQTCKQQYDEALQILNDKKFDDAHDIFVKLGSYSDSEKQANESLYQKGEDLFAKGSYQSAINIFSELDYKDSSDKINEVKQKWYKESNDYLKEKEYYRAIGGFSSLGDYKESKDKLLKAQYRQANEAYKRKDYAKAVNYFLELPMNYFDVEKKIYKCMIEFVRKYKNNETSLLDLTMYDYLKELKKRKEYKSEAQRIWDELYSWKITDFYWNTSEDSDKKMTTISKFDPVYCHSAIKGGEPGKTLKYRMSFTNPEGYSEKSDYAEGWSGSHACWYWEDGIYSRPYYGKTGYFSIRFYDDKDNLLGQSSVYIGK